MPRSPGHLRHDQRRATREAILDAATHLLAQHGYASFRVAAVAKSAGVSLGGQLHHFPTKDALVIAVLTRLSDRVLAIAAADAARDAEGLELLDLIAESATRFYATPEFLVYLDIFLSVRRHTLIGDTASALLASQRAAIESLWLPHLTFRGVDERTATMIVRGLWALARGLAISSVREGGPGDSGPTVSFVIEGMRRLVSLDAGTSRVHAVSRQFVSSF